MKDLDQFGIPGRLLGPKEEGQNLNPKHDSPCSAGQHCLLLLR